MGFFQSVASLPGQAIRDIRKTFDRITGVEAERQAAKRETKKIKDSIAQIKRRVDTSPKPKPKVSTTTVDSKLTGRNFATKQGLRRLSYSYNGRLLELQLDMSALEKDIATDLKALKSAVEETQKEQSAALEKALEEMSERVKAVEDAAKMSAETQEKTLAQVSDELGDLRTYTQTLDAEQNKKAESMRFLQGPLLGILNNVVTALNATDRPVNPIGIYISEGVEAYAKLEGSSNVDPEALRWLEIAGLAARAYAYYDSQEGFSSVFGPDKARSKFLESPESFEIASEMRDTLANLRELEERLNKRLGDEE